MKSAYELAMERLGENIENFDEEQKKELAQVDEETDAKIAQVKVQTEEKLKGVDGEQAEKMRTQLVTEIKGLNEHRERRKEELRKKFREENKKRR
ncbi:MAG: hypothetical protein ACOCZS_00610 [Verrucomicrobiota bacterium]